MDNRAICTGKENSDSVVSFIETHFVSYSVGDGGSSIWKNPNFLFAIHYETAEEAGVRTLRRRAF